MIINLVSNSLKFTPEGGKVEVRIKCLGEAEAVSEGSRNSIGSKQSSQRTSRNRHRNDSGSNSQVSRKPSNSAANPAGTALFLNAADPKSTPRIHIRERSPTPPPANAKILIFQFEVEDTGPGIPEHLRDRVFEPFVQGDLGLSKKYGGTGLGLVRTLGFPISFTYATYSSISWFPSHSEKQPSASMTQLTFDFLVHLLPAR